MGVVRSSHCCVGGLRSPSSRPVSRHGSNPLTPHHGLESPRPYYGATEEAVSQEIGPVGHAGAEVRQLSAVRVTPGWHDTTA